MRDGFGSLTAHRRDAAQPRPARRIFVAAALRVNQRVAWISVGLAMMASGCELGDSHALPTSPAGATACGAAGSASPRPGTACGNKRIDPGEQCEVGVADWNDENCDTTACTRKSYTKCTLEENACPPGSHCNNDVCSPLCNGTAGPDPTLCPRMPPEYQFYCELYYCILECQHDEDCPLGLICSHNACAGKPF
jgi:hypothetical protein